MRPALLHLKMTKVNTDICLPVQDTLYIVRWCRRRRLACVRPRHFAINLKDALKFVGVNCHIRTITCPQWPRTAVTNSQYTARILTTLYSRIIKVLMSTWFTLYQLLYVTGLWTNVSLYITVSYQPDTWTDTAQALNLSERKVTSQVLGELTHHTVQCSIV